jgi:hypothetical protein
MSRHDAASMVSRAAVRSAAASLAPGLLGVKTYSPVHRGDVGASAQNASCTHTRPPAVSGSWPGDPRLRVRGRGSFRIRTTSGSIMLLIAMLLLITVSSTSMTSMNCARAESRVGGERRAQPDDRTRMRASSCALLGACAPWHPCRCRRETAQTRAPRGGRAGAPAGPPSRAAHVAP